MTTTTKPPVTFWIVSILALLWNLMGTFQFIILMTVTPEALADLPPEQQQLLTDVPAWANIAFGITVFASVAGCILLLTRKASAVPVFSIAFAAIMVQMVYTLAMSKAIEINGPAGLLMPALIILVGAFLIWYARKARSLGWLR